MSGLMDTLPVNGDILEYMAGAVAFHRGFPEIVEAFRDEVADDPESVSALLEADLRRRGSASSKLARHWILDVFGGSCNSSEMAAALEGFRREAQVSLARKLDASSDESFLSTP